VLVARREGRRASPSDRFLAPSLAAAASLVLAAFPALAADTHGGGHGLVLAPEWTELVPLIVLFLLLIPLVNGLLFKPVFRILDAREERIDGARRRAERVERDAASVLERYRAAVSEVRAESDAERKTTLEAARRAQAEQVARERAEAERRMEATKREIDGALASARESLRRDAQALAREAAARILGRALS
jgi:F-type H+-transporting ATPase subunit b